MEHKVDISEVIEFSDELKTASEDIKSSLKKVEENIEQINAMESFSGKAAKEAKGYFNDLHKTILESFNGLFTDLDNNLKKHLDEFGSSVDSSDSAIILNDYLKDTEEDVSDDYEELSEKQDTINGTIDNVADISSATAPSFSKVTSNAEEAVKVITDLEEKLDSFTSTGDASQTKDLLHQIEVTMKNAKTNDGIARFTDYKGDSKKVGLAKLKDYNQGKMEEEMEKAKDARDSTIKDLNKTSSKDVVNKAYQEFKDGDIKYVQYIAILDSVKNTSGNMNRVDLEEESTESFIKYLQDHDMLDKYVEDHKPFGHYVVASVPSAARGSLKTFFEKLGYNRKEMADYLRNSDEKIKSVVNKTDSKFLREISKSSSWSDGFFKTANYLKWGGWALTGLGVYVGYQGDRDNGKTVGEALTHNLASLGGSALGAGLTFGAIALGASPVGWAAAAGIGISFAATFTFEYLYDNNIFGVQDGLDKAGQKIDEWWSDGKEAVSDFFQNPGDSIASGFDAINPFT
ncbi:MAG TPA: T7SS effector LXG polymorphic toxin [Candidatus Dormibacteraeota bacterium]|nr:T7SS effector LXG polymorphic toxin [Candidatus Dormibacteraeota bacterium]